MSTFTDLEKDAASVDGFVNENGLIPTRRNGPKPSYQYLVDEMRKSRGFRVVGTFADGFTYELFNDVGIDADGNSWIYVGAGAPNKVVTAGTVPSVGDGYQQVTFNAASGVIDSSGSTVQDFIDTSKAQGIMPWDAVITYPVDGIAKGSDGNIYISLIEQNGNNPVSDGGTNWGMYIKKNAILTTASVANMKSLNLKSGLFVNTTSYYDGWAATLFPEGSGTYAIATLNEIRSLLGNPSWNPDEYGDHTLSNGNVAFLIKNDYMPPESYGAKGNGVYDDSLHVVPYMKEVKKQRWTPSKTYILNSDTAGDSRAFEVLSDTEMVGYGATVDMIGSSNNGFYFGFANGQLFRNQIKGFRFTQSNADSITNAVLIEGFVNDMVIEDCVGVGMDQYFIGMGGDNSGYNNLTVRNNKAIDINPQANNEFSLCFEFFPKLASKDLFFYGNLGEQSGWGGVFKIHTCENSFIHDNVFIRTTNVGNSQSQAVMLGGRITNPTNETHFHDNVIYDANSSLGALFIGNTSTGTYITGKNVIKGAGSTIWVGGSITDSEIVGVTVDNIYSLGATSNIDNLTIEDCKISAIDFSAPPSGNKPNSVNDLFIRKNKISSRVRIAVTTSSENIKIHRNDFDNVESKSIFACDNISFKHNDITLGDGWTAGSQFADVADAVTGYRQMHNTWNMKGLVAQTVWLNGTTDAQVVGETIENALTRSVLDSGTNSEIFDNRLKLNGGSWAVV